MGNNMSNKINNFDGIVAYHMVKCGGTTLDYILRNNFGFNFINVWPIQGQTDQFNRLVCTNKDLKKFIGSNTKAIRGHGIRPYKMQFRNNANKIIFLREPISRYLSHHNHWNTKLGYKTIEVRVFDAEEDNYQVNFIAGCNDLNLAKEIVNDYFNFIGLVEEYNTSLIIMKKLLGLNDFDIRYVKKNYALNPNYLRKEHLGTDLFNKIKEKNKLDTELYNYVKSRIFKNYITQYGGSLENDLRVFNKDCENFRFSSYKLKSFSLNFRFKILMHKLFYKPKFNSCLCSRIILDNSSKCERCLNLEKKRAETVVTAP